VLHLVPPTPPTPADELRQRIRENERWDGDLQCNRCGCRTAITLVQGAKLRKGRVTGGVVLARYACAECWARGAHVEMRNPLTPIK
jgi:DNA-directed RNA polymerase subunit RPC12/RpoP